MKQIILSPVTDLFNDVLIIEVTKNTIFFRVELDGAGNTFKMEKSDLLKILGGGCNAKN